MDGGHAEGEGARRSEGKGGGGSEHETVPLGGQVKVQGRYVDELCACQRSWWSSIEGEEGGKWDIARRGSKGPGIVQCPLVKVVCMHRL
jgi:hypothetical protein